MDINLKFDYKEALKNYNDMVEKLQQLGNKKVIVKIDESKVHEETGIKVETIAFYMEYGNDELNVYYPSRPFWRNTLIKYENKLQKRFESNIQALLDNKISVNECYEDLGKQLKRYIEATIKEGNFQPLSESTLKKRKTKGRGSQPLIDTGTLINSIVYEVI